MPDKAVGHWEQNPEMFGMWTLQQHSYSLQMVALRLHLKERGYMKSLDLSHIGNIPPWLFVYLYYILGVSRLGLQSIPSRRYMKAAPPDGPASMTEDHAFRPYEPHEPWSKIPIHSLQQQLLNKHPNVYMYI